MRTFPDGRRGPAAFTETPTPGEQPANLATDATDRSDRRVPAAGRSGRYAAGDHRHIGAVFAQRGYHATGIMELCAANDLGKGALYHYIGSKEEFSPLSTTG